MPANPKRLEETKWRLPLGVETMTDRSPDFYAVEFFEGPLEGLKFDVPYYPDKLLLLLDNGTRFRYEADQQTTEKRDNGESWGDVSRMVLARDAESFDEELAE